MNSSLVCIGILVKSNISRLCLINFLNQVSSSALRKYLGAGEVYDGNANDISLKSVLTILKDHNITIK